MQEEIFYVHHIKCDGCIKAIKEALEKRTEISHVEIDKELGNIVLFGDDFDKEDIAIQLALIGYPEKNNNE